MTPRSSDTSEFVARFAPDTATKAVRRSWRSAALWAVIGASLVVIASMVFAPNPVAPIAIAATTLVGVITCIVSASRAHTRWAADDGLAIAVGNAGVTLPHVGLIPWNRIVGVQSSLTPGVEWQPGGRPRSTGYLDVFVTDSLEALNKLPVSARRQLVTGGPNSAVGFRAAEGTGLTPGEFADASAALLGAAAARGIAVAPWGADHVPVLNYAPNPSTPTAAPRDLAPSGDTYSAYYSTQAASTFAIRGWIGVGVWITLAAIFFTVFGFTVMHNLALAFTVAAIMLAGAGLAGHAALRSRERWATDQGLAIAINDTGVTIPGVGDIPWANITGVRSFDMSIITGNVPLFAFQAWHGIQARAYLSVYVSDSLASLNTLPALARRRLVSGGPQGSWGFATAYRQALEDAVFAEASAVLLGAARQRGIPVVP